MTTQKQERCEACVDRLAFQEKHPKMSWIKLSDAEISEWQRIESTPCKCQPEAAPKQEKCDPLDVRPGKSFCQHCYGIFNNVLEHEAVCARNPNPSQTSFKSESLLNNSARDWNDDFDHENGKYQNLCYACHQMFVGHKRRVICRACHDDRSSRTDPSDPEPTIAKSATVQESLTPEVNGFEEWWNLGLPHELQVHEGVAKAFAKATWQACAKAYERRIYEADKRVATYINEYREENYEKLQEQLAAKEREIAELKGQLDRAIHPQEAK